MSASTHGTPASGYGTDLLRLVCFEHIYGYTFPCTHQQGATRMTSTHPAGGATCWPNDVDADRHTNIHGAAYPVVIRARYRSSGRGPIGSRRWAWRGVYIRGDPGWWYHEAKGKGSIPSAATHIYKYIAELEYVA